MTSFMYTPSSLYVREKVSIEYEVRRRCATISAKVRTGFPSLNRAVEFKHTLDLVERLTLLSDFLNRKLPEVSFKPRTHDILTLFGDLVILVKEISTPPEDGELEEFHSSLEPRLILFEFKALKEGEIVAKEESLLNLDCTEIRAFLEKCKSA